MPERFVLLIAEGAEYSGLLKLLLLSTCTSYCLTPLVASVASTQSKAALLPVTVRVNAAGTAGAVMSTVKLLPPVQLL